MIRNIFKKRRLGFSCVPCFLNMEHMTNPISTVKAIGKPQLENSCFDRAMDTIYRVHTK